MCNADLVGTCMMLTWIRCALPVHVWCRMCSWFYYVWQQVVSARASQLIELSGDPRCAILSRIALALLLMLFGFVHAMQLTVNGLLLCGNGRFVVLAGDVSLLWLRCSLV